MRVLGWAFVAAGLLIGVSSFVLTAHAPTVNPWPFFGAGLGMTLIGIFVLMTEGRNRGND